MCVCLTAVRSPTNLPRARYFSKCHARLLADCIALAQAVSWRLPRKFYNSANNRQRNVSLLSLPGPCLSHFPTKALSEGSSPILENAAATSDSVTAIVSARNGRRYSSPIWKNRGRTQCQPALLCRGCVLLVSRVCSSGAQSCCARSGAPKIQIRGETGKMLVV